MSSVARLRPATERPAEPPQAPPWATLIEGLTDAVWLVRGQRVLAINEAALRLLGTRRERALGAPPQSLLGTPEDDAFWEEVARGHATGLDSQALLVRPDGGWRHVQRRIRPGPDGLWMVALRDDTEAREREDERESLLAELRATLEATADAILVTDLAGRIRACNRRFVALWGLPEELLEGGHDAAVWDWMRRSVVDGDADAQRIAALQDAALQRSCERLRLHSGEVVERVSLPQLRGGRVIGRVWSFRDLSERLAAEGRLEAARRTDALTGLANRSRLHEQLAESIGRARSTGKGLALLLLDLDRFKQVNDSLGRDAADRVLAEVSARLQRALREADSAARVGGDQFAVLLHDAGARGAERTARRILDAVAKPFAVAGAHFTLTASAGIALFPGDGGDADVLLRGAETAMQQAKQGGRAGYRFHRAGRERSDLRERMRLEHAMRQALVAQRFRLDYQPQVALADGRLQGAEALIRWNDEERGELSPAQFIPVAEESGFIVALGDWVLSEAARQAALWHAQGRDCLVAVNVSALQFQQAGFVDRVAEVLRGAGLPPRLLELELTESILLRDADEALARLSALAALGVRLAIDDFGTGYSSLAYLKRFPIHRLKVDRSFVRGLPGDASDAAIVRAIVQMGAALGLDVVAEGVETEPQRRFLRDAGCHAFQGHLFAPALAPQLLEQRLAAA